MFSGDTVGLYGGPQPELEGQCSPSHDFTIFALDSELPYIKAELTVLARTHARRVPRPDIAGSPIRPLPFWGRAAFLSDLAKTSSEDHRGPFCIGVMRTEPVPPMESSPSAI